MLSFGSLYPASANVPSHNLVHHHFDDDGQPDWAAPDNVSFRWNLLNLVHFPNVAGPTTFGGVTRWAALAGKKDFVRQYRMELAFAFGLTALLAARDFWTTLFFVVVPQLYGARCILRINLIPARRLRHGQRVEPLAQLRRPRLQLDHVQQRVPHELHHNRAGLHWSVLDEAHAREGGCRASTPRSTSEHGDLPAPHLRAPRAAPPGRATWPWPSGAPP